MPTGTESAGGASAPPFLIAVRAARSAEGRHAIADRIDQAWAGALR